MHTTLQQVLILLAAAVVIVVVFRSLRLPPLVGYLIVGVMIGPHALGWIHTTEQVSLLADRVTGAGTNDLEIDSKGRPHAAFADGCVTSACIQGVDRNGPSTAVTGP